MHYLDHNATTPLRAGALEAMVSGAASARNAMSLHHHGRKSRVTIDQARERLRTLLDFPKAEVIFTSGGTEADNLAIVGFSSQAREERGANQILLSPWEHPAVTEPALHLESSGFEVHYLPTTPHGTLDVEQAKAMISPKVALVAVMLAQNETGLILDVAGIAALCHSAGVHLHCDAVQGVGKVPLSARLLGVDSLAITAHKFGGPRGIGALLSMKGIRPRGLWKGGGQEEGTRSGTQPTPLVSGMEKALELSIEDLDKYAKLRKNHDKFEARLVDELGLGVIGAEVERLPNTTSVWVPALKSGRWVEMLSERGFAISAGAACHAGASGPSRIHQLVGQTDLAMEMLRISTGLETNEEALDDLCASIMALLTH